MGLVDRALESVHFSANVGSFLVDYIPSLQYLPRECRLDELSNSHYASLVYTGWFPGMKFMSLADGWRKDVEAMQEEPFIYASGSLVCTCILIHLHWSH